MALNKLSIHNSECGWSLTTEEMKQLTS